MGIKTKTSFEKGHKRGMTGKKHKTETIEKMRKNHRGGIQKGEKLSEEHKEKISEALKGRIPKNLKTLHENISGENNHGWKGGKPKCLDCGKEIGYTSLRCRKCNSKFLTGEKHPAWNGGISKTGYSYKFSKKLKEKIIKRDNNRCQLCGLTSEESINYYKRELSVNHIDFNKENCEEENLNTLCCFCNSSINCNRQFFTEYFKAKVFGKEKEVSKNIETMQSFKHFCRRNKEQRFWQALRNWNQIENPKEGFILVSDIPPYQMEDAHFLIEDTFGRE